MGHGEVGSGGGDRAAITHSLTITSFDVIGSYVSLNDGRVGRVIRSNGERYTEPVIEVWERKRLNAHPAVIDVSEESHLQIKKALPNLTEAFS